MPDLDRGGVRVHYDVSGDGPTVLLSHGYSADHRMWDGQLAALGVRYRVVTWDMRGHGDSDSPDDPALYSEAHTVADMAAVLDAVGAQRAVIGGLSLGGFMSLAFHLAHPERVAALMLFDTGPGYRKDEARDQWNAQAERIAGRYEERGLDALPDSPETGGAQHRSAEGLARAARGMLAQRDARVIDSLPGVAVPTLVLVGGDDEPYLGASDYMASKIPGARKVVVPDAGHAANIDQPEAFNRAVLEFLDGLGR